MKAIKFIHDIVHRGDYIYVSEFFRFIGVFICEDIVEKDENLISAMEQNTKYDVCIYVGKVEKDTSTIWSKEEYQRFEAELPKDAIKLYDTMNHIEELESMEEVQYPIISWKNKENQKKVLNHIILKISNLITVDIPKKLTDIYVNNKLAYHSINLQYYPKKKSFVTLTAKSKFIKSYEDLREWEYEHNFYTSYALLWCKVKANLACDYGNEIAYFFIAELEKQCQELCEKYPEFSNAKVLLGLCYEPFKGSVNDALRAFSGSLFDIKENAYSSSVYYWMGKWFEYYEKKLDAEKTYALANKRKIKYRSTFKLAVLAKEKKDDALAIAYLDQILFELDLKIKNGFCDPLELQYVFKTYCQKCHIYYKLEDDNRIIENGEKAVKLIKEIDNNVYLKELYGRDLEKYKELIIQRLYPANIYWFLVGAYRNIGDEENTKKYQEELNKISETV